MYLSPILYVGSVSHELEPVVLFDFLCISIFRVNCHVNIIAFHVLYFIFLVVLFEVDWLANIMGLWICRHVVMILEYSDNFPQDPLNVCDSISERYFRQFGTVGVIIVYTRNATD